MDKQEPKIIAPGYSNEELFAWMSAKVGVARELNGLFTAKNEQLNYLDKLEVKISELSSQAAIEVVQHEEIVHDEFSTPVEEMITIDKALFKQLLQLVLKLPDLGSHLATVNVDSGSAPAGEVLIRLEPSDFLLRLNTALGACR